MYKNRCLLKPWLVNFYFDLLRIYFGVREKFKIEMSRINFIQFNIREKKSMKQQFILNFYFSPFIYKLLAN